MVAKLEGQPIARFLSGVTIDAFVPLTFDFRKDFQFSMISVECNRPLFKNAFHLMMSQLPYVFQSLKQ